MSWFSRQKAPKPISVDKEALDRGEMPEDIWTKCPECSAILYTKELKRNYGVCVKCNHHFRLTAVQRIGLIVDRHSFVEMDANMRSVDPLRFRDTKRYRDRLAKAEKSAGTIEAVVTGRARILNIPIMLGVFNIGFIGGSMGVVVGEKLTRLIEMAIQERKPVIIVSASGGARMQEGIFSLMQMAKVSAVLTKLSAAKLPYISVLCDPTTGGVAASFAMLGDVILAEPKALIGFAGPRVIEKTIRQTLPQGFQTAEFVLEHGMIDRIVQRPQMREDIALILKNFGFNS